MKKIIIILFIFCFTVIAPSSVNSEKDMLETIFPYFEYKNLNKELKNKKQIIKQLTLKLNNINEKEIPKLHKDLSNVKIKTNDIYENYKQLEKEFNTVNEIEERLFSDVERMIKIFKSQESFMQIEKNTEKINYEIKEISNKEIQLIREINLKIESLTNDSNSISVDLLVYGASGLINAINGSLFNGIIGYIFQKKLVENTEKNLIEIDDQLIQLKNYENILSKKVKYIIFEIQKEKSKLNFLLNQISLLNKKYETLSKSSKLYKLLFLALKEKSLSDIEDIFESTYKSNPELYSNKKLLELYKKINIERVNSIDFISLYTSDNLKKSSEYEREYGEVFLNYEEKVEKISKIKYLELNSTLQEDIKENHQNLNDLFEHSNKISKELLNIRNIIKNIEFILWEIDEEFLEKSKLEKEDLAFIALSTTLHSFRWWLSPTKQNKLSSKEGDQKAQNLVKKTLKNRSATKILSEKIPYDDTSFLSGTNHRAKTLGHDPILGWLFGVHDILAYTMTTTESIKSFQTIDANNYVNKRLLNESFQEALIIVKNDKKILPLAVAKQCLHLYSDINTKKGLPIPIINIVSDDLGNWLNRYDYDFLHVTKQIGLAQFIDFIVGTLHTFFQGINHTDDHKELQKIKTMKVLAYGNLGSNLLNVAYLKISTKKKSKFDEKRIDFAGYLNTIHRIIKSQKFKKQMKKEFLETSIDDIMSENINEKDNVGM